MDGRDSGRGDPPWAVDRRQFLKVAGVLGAAAAGARTVFRAREVRADPDPPSGDADVVFIHSTCQMCDSRCGLKAKVRRGQLLKLDGSPYHPHNRGEDERLPFARTPAESRAEFGRFCARGHAGVQALYDPQRVQHPLKRVGPRGAGRWEVVTWAQAFAEIGARVNALIPFDERLTRDIDPASPDLGKIANQLAFSPGRSIETALSDRIFKSGYGTANHNLDDASLREGSLHAGNALMTRDHVTGAPGVDELRPDLDRAAYVLVFGANPVESSPPMLALARKIAALRDPARPGGAGRVVVVDPRFSHSAAKADQWVPVKPGGDAALALGVARVILAGSRFNAAFLGNANKAAATAAGEPCYTDATWLVVVEPGHRGEGQWLTPADAGLTPVVDARHPVCVRVSDGAPVEVQLGAGAPPVVGRLEPVDAGRDFVTVNGLRCRSAFAVYRAAVFEHTLAQYAALSGVEEAVIARLAADFTAPGRRASAWAHRGAVQNTHGTYTQLAVMALNWMVGNVDHAGGLTRGGGGWSERSAPGGVDTDAVRGAATPTGPRVDRAGAGYTADKSYFAGFPAPRQWFPFASRGVHQELIPSIAQGYPYPLKVLITFWNDWPYAVPGGRAVWERTVANETSLPLLVAISPVLGEVATWADYVLPDTTHLEKWAFPGSSAATTVKASALQQPVVGALDSVTIGGDGRWSFDPTARNEYAPLLPDTKMHGDILIGLAKAISPRFPGVGVDAFGPGLNLDRAWDFYRHQLANVARNVGTGLTGATLTVADLVARGGAFAAPNSGYDPASPALLASRHASVLHFYVPALAAAQHAITGRRFRGVAHHDGVRRLDGAPVRDAAFPLQLVTYTPAFRAREQVGAGAWLAGIQPHNFVELAEPDARAAGVETGDRVRLSSASNPVGVVGVAKVVRGLRPGVVAVSRGFGRWEGGARSHLVNGRATPYDPVRGAGVNANPVMRLDDSAGDVSLQDPVGGGCSFSDTWVRVEPVAAR